ncbi:MAG: tyrosine-type recombinase/integrase [Acidobacteriota bacterium]|nr:tyrosine-type recombinase/integrase [Acidobacteriota bacterium]
MLTDVRVRTLKPRAKPYKVADRDGLYLLVQPTGGRWWRFDYRFGGTRRTLSLGVLKDVPLADARDRLSAVRKQLVSGVDPGAVRRAEKQQQSAERDTFEAVARAWLDQQRPRFAPQTIKKTTWLLEAFLFPALGAQPIAAIEAPALLAALQRIEAGKRHETAHRALQLAGQIFRYAIATGTANRNPGADLRGALAPIIVSSHAAITDPAAVGGLLRAIDGFQGSFPVGQALKLAPHVFVRPGELRQAEWTEMDLDAAIWRLPAARMKTRRAHLVPLSSQAVAILRALHPLTGRGRYVFPSIRSGARPMSDNTLNAALRRLGYDHDEMTAHGFRAMASTRLNELGWRPDLIERQLAHVESGVRAVYHRADYLDERRRMMQAWSDHLDALRERKPALVVAL